MGHIEYAHDDCPGVGHDEDSGGAFEYPLEKHPGIHIAQVVFIGNELDQLQGHNDCQNGSGDRKDHDVGKGLDHGEYAAVPGLRGQADLTGDSLNLLIGSHSVPSSSTWEAAPLQKLALAFLRLLAWAAPGDEW